MDIDASCRRFAALHHGLIDRGTARRLGLSDRQIRSRVHNGSWVRHSRDVFALTQFDPTPEQRLLRAAWAVDGRVSHASAGWLWGVLDEPGPLVHVWAPPTAAHRLAGVRVHRSGHLDAADRAKRRRIPTTSIERTLVDLAALLDADELRDAVDRALRNDLTTPDRLAARVESLPGRAGAARARDVLTGIAAERAMSESELESLLFALIEEAGLPRPTVQHRVTIQGRRYRIDLCYPDERLAIEVDGFAVHGTRAAFEADRTRQNDLVLAGWRVLRFTWRQVRGDAAGVIAQLRSALEAVD